MPMDKELLAQTLWNTLGPPVDGDGIPLPPSDGIKGYAEGWIAMITASTVVHLPGTVSGSAPPAGPLVGGKAEGGKLVGLAGPVMAAVVAKANPVAAAGLTLEATALALYMTGAALVSFPPNAIVGTSGETPVPAPGPLVAGAAPPIGMVTGLSGPSMAQTVAGATGGIASGPNQPNFYQSLADFTMASATVEYKANSVLGTMTGGQLTLGAAAGGIVT